MQKKLSNYIFAISNIIDLYKKEDNREDIVFERLAHFLTSINSFSNDANIYFLLNFNTESSLGDSQLNLSKKFLKQYNINLEENKIFFIFRKNNQINNDFSLEEIIDGIDGFDLLKENSVILFSDLEMGEFAFINGFFSIFLECGIIKNEEKYSKDFEKVINLIDGEINIDSVNYDFISFLETNNDD